MVKPNSTPTIQDLLERYGAKPQKRFGQNFLVSPDALQKVLSAADITPNDTILEVGSGTGILTLELARRAKRVVAVEKDRLMVAILQDVLKQKGVSNVTLIQKDARDITEKELETWGLSLDSARDPKLVEGKPGTSYKMVANLPYYIATPIIRKFLEIGTPPQTMVLTVQKEVAERIAAKPPHMSILALSVQFYADPEIIATMPNTAFWPKPDVDGAIIKITPHREGPDKEFSSRFFKIIKAGFSHPRKKLTSNLKNLSSRKDLEAKFEKLGIPVNARPSELSLPRWVELVSLQNS